jgi:hypothetical protein
VDDAFVNLVMNVSDMTPVVYRLIGYAQENERLLAEQNLENAENSARKWGKDKKKAVSVGA